MHSYIQWWTFKVDHVLFVEDKAIERGRGIKRYWLKCHRRLQEKVEEEHVLWKVTVLASVTNLTFSSNQFSVILWEGWAWCAESSLSILDQSKTFRVIQIVGWCQHSERILGSQLQSSLLMHVRTQVETHEKNVGTREKRVRSLTITHWLRLWFNRKPSWL